MMIRTTAAVLAVAGWVAVALVWPGHAWWHPFVRPGLAVVAGSAAILHLASYALNVSATLGSDRPGVATHDPGHGRNTPLKGPGMNQSTPVTRHHRPVA